MAYCERENAWKKRGGDSCAAYGCTNGRNKKGCEGKSFFVFPKDEERCRKWMQNCGRAFKAELNVVMLHKLRYLLCSDHFEASQFNIPHERKRLVWNAVPTLFGVPPKTSSKYHRARTSKHSRTVASHSSMEKIDPAVLSNIKVEIDVADESLQWYPTIEPQITGPVRDGVRESTAAMYDVQMLEEQASAGTHSHSDTWLEQETQTPRTQERETPETQTAINTNSGIWLKQEIETPETQTAVNTNSGIWLKQEIETPETQTSINTPSDLFLNQETETPGTQTAVNTHSSACLKNHMLIQGEKKHVCKECSARFKNSESLKKHILTHDKTVQKRGGKYVCKVCNAIFERSCLLKRHVFMHVGEKRHVCKECNAGFTDASHFEYHMVMHANERKHVCKECNTGFRWSSTLRDHMLTMHTRRNIFECTECKTELSCEFKTDLFTLSEEKKCECSNCGAKLTITLNFK